jgi:hypothetical protein
MAAAHQPLRAHEDIVVFYKAPATYNPLRTKRKTDRGKCLRDWIYEERI